MNGTPDRPAVAHVLGTPGTGGVPVVAHALLRRLPGWRPHLYYLTDRTADPVRRDVAVAALQAAGVVVRLVPADVARDKERAVDTVAGWVAQDGVRLVHTHSTRPNRYGRLAALRVPGVRVVAHYHNHYDDKWSDGSADLDLERRLAARTDHLVACSESVRDHVVDRLGVGADRVTVLRNGVDAERFAHGDGARVRQGLGVAPGTTVIGAVGRLCAQKAPDDVLEAVAPILLQRNGSGGSGPRAELWFVGAPDDAALAAALERRAAGLGVAGAVRFLGYRADVPDVYAALDVVVLASRWEGFGLVVAEAMAAGRPVVATDVGGVGEAAGTGLSGGPAALLVPPGDVAALRAGVADVLARPALAADLALRGVGRSATLGWGEAAAALDVLYRDVLSRPVPAAEPLPVGAP
ncbi:glycosyltransferase family 4 protein [Kineosporia sp. A_224]|uniref:glycosyltransferase family 4 protein n=1 Tax=Kineosporia sp. A_224 TaxID=1962180 RepID=UPI0013046495|nr:glycosyltransferase family 4 protein [Kineosporia sp. A_224]